ncbi:MAG: hypothetical protein IKA03_03495 [Alphaproteobacteria bacterium]|nr:hypothetical protein [Alphaproteobacteria bacterium]
MKKLFYIALVVIVLLVIGYVAKQKFATTEPEVVVVEEEIAVISPATAEDVANEVIGDGEVVDEEVAEDVVESNPEDTADEGETFVD